MKRFMSMILMAAVVVTSVVVPNSNNVETVKAATSVTYSVSDFTVDGQKYDNYEDFLEAICVALEYEKVDLDTYSYYSYINENNEKVYYTYRQYFTKQNYVISDDCVSILYIGSNAYIAYKADGTKVIIYNTEGYDVMGYDREGYNKDGYDREGYDRYGCRRDGYNDEGYDKDGYDRNGYDKDGYDRNGYNKDGYDEDGRNKFGVKEVLVQAHDKNGAAGTELFFALEYGIGTCFGGQKGEAFFFDKNGKLYKKCSNVEFIVSSKPFGKGKVYYRRNRKTKKPSRYNPKGNKYRDGNKYSTYFNMSKSIKKGRHVTYRFYKKIKGEKCYMYSYTSNVAK